MATATEILAELQPLGRESYKKVLRNHGVVEPFFGVKVEELKKFQKRIRKDYQLALDLYATGNYDAMYLAGLIADETRMTKKDLERWVRGAQPLLCGSSVTWVAAESPQGRALALEWIESSKEHIAVAGWGTLGGLVALLPDDELDVAELKQLLQRVQRTIHQQPNKVRYAMNNFVIAVGAYVAALTDFAVKTAEKIGKVKVDMGNTECKVPDAVAYIRKIQDRGTIGKKRKTVRC